MKNTPLKISISMAFLAMFAGLVVPTGRVFAENSANPPTTSGDANWENVAEDFLKQVGANDVKTVYRRRSQGLIVTPTGDLFLLTGSQGVCVSKDQGATWSVVADNHIDGLCGYGSGFDSSVSLPYPYDGRMAFFCFDGKGETSGGMSVDGGKTWKPFAKFKRGFEFGDVDWSDKDAKTLYGVTHEPYFSIYSNDGGTSWQRLDMSETGAAKEGYGRNYCVGVVSAKTFVRYNPQVEGGILEVSEDAGQSWTKVPMAYHILNHQAVHYGKKLYWTAAEGVITSDDGKNWTLTGPGAEAAIFGPYFGASEQEFVVVSDKSFLKTTDGGKTWKPIAKVFKPTDVFAHLKPTYYGWDSKNDILYLSGNGSSVFRLRLRAEAKK